MEKFISPALPSLADLFMRKILRMSGQPIAPWTLHPERSGSIAILDADELQRVRKVLSRLEVNDESKTPG